MSSYFCSASEPSHDAFKVWIGTRLAAPSATLRLRIDPGGDEISVGPLAPWPTTTAPLFFSTRVNVSGLAPGTHYTIVLAGAGHELARCEARTLPNAIGGENDPLIVFLGSCFARTEDRGAGPAYAGLPAAARPHFNVFAGDQVYLDAESRSFGGNTAQELREIFSQAYWETWTGAGKSLHEALSRRASFFLSEDHEFWNNYPLRNAAGVDTWLPWGAGRDVYAQIANELYERFQGGSGFTSFDIAPASFALLDTRRYRDNQLVRLCRNEDIQALRQWALNLRGPGFLVSGQPIFDTESPWYGRVTDLSLPDYTQYEEILRILASARQSIVLLTGDVHYARFAGAQRISGTDLLEIIASPLAIVRGARGRWSRSPEKLRWADRAGLDIEAIRTDDEPRLNEEHFLTLELSAVGSRLDGRLKYWGIDGGSTPRMRHESQFTLRS